MATRRNLTREDFFEDAARLELVKNYLKMGQWEDARTQCRILVQRYKSLGMKTKATKVMALMGRIDPSEAGPKEEITGLIPPMKLKARKVVNNRSEEAAIREGFIDETKKEAYFDLAAELAAAKPENTPGFNRKSETNIHFDPSKNDQNNDKKRKEIYCFFLLASIFLWLLQN